MCDPVSAGIGLALAAGTVKAYGAYTGHRMQAEAAIANAQSAEQTGYQNELAFRDEARHKLADQEVRLAAQGTSIDTGTPLLLLAESAKNSELDALAIRRNALMQARAYRYEAAVHRFAAPLSAAGELLSAGTQAASLASIGGGGGAPATFDPGSGNWTPGPGGFPGG